MQCKNLHFSGHALQRMFERNISETDIKSVINTGQVLKEYPTDKPHPSHLMLGFAKKQPLHVVFATDTAGNCYIITAYRPTAENWGDNFTTKK